VVAPGKGVGGDTNSTGSKAKILPPEIKRKAKVIKNILKNFFINL
jgi:hypothetical protein